ncbi:MAG: hypothetical protein ABI091_06550, partial [Ferruginibacter sp.]
MKRIVLIFMVSLSLAAQGQISKKKSITIQGIDASKKPGDNFFLYVNSKWYDTAQIPASQSGVGA